MRQEFEDFKLLQSAGIQNPLRCANLIRTTVNSLNLDLRGLTVLTEAANGPYAATPVIAALAGADEVFALTRDSNYASADCVIAQTRALERVCGTTSHVHIGTERKGDWFSSADIVTNLGFVRPLNAGVIAWMKPTAVIPIMYEAWELRPGDLDLAACRSKGISVYGTNESLPKLQIFDYCGWLALKLLFEAQIEVFKSNIIVVSTDAFGKVVTDQLEKMGVKVTLASNLVTIPRARLANADALLLADYLREDMLLGPGGEMEAKTLAELAPGITIIQLVGWADANSLIEQGITVYPGYSIGPKKMSTTLAGLGPRPLIELNAAGLKVGEITARSKKIGQPWRVLESQQGFEGLIQEVL